MSRLASYEPERVELPDGHEAWITPVFAARAYAEWYESLPGDDRPDPIPPLPAEALFAMLAVGVTAWSLTDDDGQRLPVNLVTVSALTWRVGKPLSDWCNELIGQAALEQIEATGKALKGES